jgi:soluble lytic murein transglycosylase-like protein
MKWAQIRIVGLATVVVLLTVVGFAAGFRTGSQMQIVVANQHDAIEREVLNWIVERNPDARIRDFNGFVQSLFEVARETNIEWEWILALADKESQMHPTAIGSSGEIGLMQILPSTAKLIAERIKDESFQTPGPIVRDKLTGKVSYVSLGSLGDPRINIRYGTLYLKWQKDVFKQWPVALRAYNRNPDAALEHRPHDRYAEDIAFKFIALREQFRAKARRLSGPVTVPS